IGIGTVINYSSTPFNSDDIKEIIEFAKANELNIRASSYMYPCVRCTGGYTGENEGRFSPSDAAKFRIKFDCMYYGKADFLSRAEQLIADVKSGIQPEVFEKDSVLCRAGSTSFWVDWQGNMSMCGMIPAKIRNILTDGFDKCWNDIKSQTEKLRLYKGCTECKYRFFCNVCAAVCLAETGDFDKKPEYVCKMTEETYFEVIEELRRKKG
ncbi:MAG: SPASM domain-containing protein, partial [Ruminococcus sp.]|nr:SPASM domain-containing protein [Candidatus Copronaster equi]